ncbi:MAG: carbamoyltransferase HypF [Thiotrichales bacterium]
MLPVHPSSFPPPGVACAAASSELIRIRGTVQGVGFRPMVWRAANAAGVVGTVCNDGEGVLIRAHGAALQIDNFVSTVLAQCPPLGFIADIERTPIEAAVWPSAFTITDSEATAANTQLPADAATCEACLTDTLDPANRRYGYPFTNCTHCGPRLSLMQGIPYDRANTTMSAFELCPACAAEYADPTRRRFHAQPNACPDCGPSIWLEVAGARLSERAEALQEAVARLNRGEVVAIKGVGGVHLAVDAGNAEALALLRQRKRRPDKPLALMARDLEQIRQWCRVSPEEEAALRSSAAPVVLLPRLDTDGVGDCLIAPRQATLGFMLPYSPLHHLLMAQLERPVVLTSGNRSGEPQCISNVEARERLGGIADALLLHDRPIANRVDDSVLRSMGGTMRPLRRARGYAPEPVALPKSFPQDLDLLAMGGELKGTFCLLQRGRAILSQHMGDLENHATFEDYQKNITLFTSLYQHRPQALVVDRHPDYLSSKLGREWAQARDLPLLEVQHHHAHMAACMAENAVEIDTAPVLGIVLDGLGFGDDGALWGGEFLLADYRDCQRLASLRPAPLPGAAQAMREPWRNLWAQLWRAGIAEEDFPASLASRPVETMERMALGGINSPLASSCGRLFDAVAAALGICVEGISYEGQAAIELEALLRRLPDSAAAAPSGGGYPFGRLQEGGLLRLDPAPMWRSLLDDLRGGVSAEHMAHRFQQGLAEALVAMASELAAEHGVSQVVLSGGVFQNRALFEAVVAGLEGQLKVLSHRRVPMNDGGLSLGQAAVAAARMA